MYCLCLCVRAYVYIDARAGGNAKQSAAHRHQRPVFREKGQAGLANRRCGARSIRATREGKRIIYIHICVWYTCILRIDMLIDCVAPVESVQRENISIHVCIICVRVVYVHFMYLHKMHTRARAHARHTHTHTLIIRTYMTRICT